MSEEINCPLCKGASYIISEEGSIRILKCELCGKEFTVRVHYVEPSMLLETKVYNAFVKVDDPTLVRKLQLKVKRAFEGKSNFYSEDLDRQIIQGLAEWDLGFYAEQEIGELKLAAEKVGLKVDFRPA